MTRKTIDDLLREARSRLERLEPEEALAAQREGAMIVDTRSHDERVRHGVIPGFHRATDIVGGFTAWQEHGLPVSLAPEVKPNAVPGMGGPDE